MLAVDADPDANLGSALGIDTTDLVPVAKMEKLIHERTGVQPGTVGGFFKMNPHVEDLARITGSGKGWGSPVGHGYRQERWRRLHLPGKCPSQGPRKPPGSGPKGSSDKDTEAGIEHLGRGTAQGVDRL